MTTRTYTTLVIAAVVVGALLRLFHLAEQSLWIDEIFTIAAASGSWGEMIFAPRAATNIPPFYYAIIHALGLENGGEFALRLPSVAFGVLTLPLIASVARNWLGERVAVIAIWIAALSPFHVWYSQDARPYALLILLSTLAVAARQSLDHACAQGRDHWWPRLLFALCAASLVYCHTVGIALIVVLGVIALWGAPKRQRVREWFTFGAIGILLVPAVALVVAYPVAPVPEKSIDNLTLLLPPYTLWTFAAGYSIGPSVGDLHRDGRMQAMWEHVWVVGPALCLLAGVTFSGVWHLWRRQHAVRVALLVWLLLPIALGILASSATVQNFNVRHASTAYPAFVIVLAVGIAAVERRWLQGVLGALVLALSQFGLFNYYFDSDYHKADSRGAAGVLNESARDGEVVIASAVYARPVLRHYCLAPARQTLRFPKHPPTSRLRDPDVVSGWLQRIGVLAAEGSAQAPNAVVDRVWLFLSRTYHGDQDGVIATQLQTVYDGEICYEGPEAQLWLFERRP
ncbi:MAG: glycosyltransferase family 39 protein [Planctomycetota bacterium]